MAAANVFNVIIVAIDGRDRGNIISTATKNNSLGEAIGTDLVVTTGN